MAPLLSLTLRSAARYFARSALISSKHSRYYSAMSGLLIEDQKYSFLKDLGLSAQNKGVFDGKWGGSGEEITTYSPTTNQAIATVIQGSPADYENAIKAAREAWEVWAEKTTFGHQVESVIG